MKVTSNFSSLFLLTFLWKTTGADDTLSRYKQPLPPDVKIIATGPQLSELQDANPGALIGPENGGWYLKYPDSGKVVAASSGNLTVELDRRWMNLYFTFKDEGNHEEAADVLQELQENGADMEKLKEYNCGGPAGCVIECCNNPRCVYPGKPGKCVLYTNCYWCGARHKCI